MRKKYTQKEINKFMLGKNLNEFYLAIIENRNLLLTDEEYVAILGKEIVYSEDTKDNIENLVHKINSNDNSKKYNDELMKILFSVGQIRYLAILTMIDDDIYDIANQNFIDLKRNKIISYDKFDNYYHSSIARVKIFTKKEVPQLNEPCALMDLDTEEIINEYEKNYINQEENDDLTRKFLKEVTGKAYTLKK